MIVRGGTKTALDYEKLIRPSQQNGFEFNFVRAIITVPHLPEAKGIDGKFISR
jgi:hypothetical protein